MNFILQKRPWKDLTPGQRMFGLNEPPEMQLENMWEVVDRYSGEKLTEPLPDFAEFSGSDKMYPSMMKPEVKARWELKNREWEQAKERYHRIKRTCHACFIHENQDLSLARNLAGTAYGKEVLAELQRERRGYGRQDAYSREPIVAEYSDRPQTGTGAVLHDEFARDRVELDPAEAVCTTPFTVPGTETPFSLLATARNETGRIAEKLLALAPKDHHLQYEYDAGGRLSKVWKDDRVIEHYQYGKHGERLMSETFHSGIRRFVYGEGLRLVRAGEVKYSYDPKGRLTMKQDRGQVTRYEYDHNNQLVQVHLPDGRRINYIVDPNGMRTAKQVDGRTVETYLWKDRATLLAVSDEQGRLKEFAYDGEGDPIAMRWNGEVYHLASDQVGTVYMVANAKGNEVKRIIYDSFGNTMVDTSERINLSLGFAAGLYDRDTGLIHFGYREYDPATGRFTCPDPLGYAGGDVDVYGYCADDPVNFVDRVGLKKRSEEGEKDIETEDHENKAPNESTNDSITGMNILKERQALKEKNDKQDKDAYPIKEVHVYHENGTMEVHSDEGPRDTYKFSSGKPGETDQTKKDVGPTPSGEYEFDPKESSEVEGLRYSIRNTIFGDWGHGRVPLHPSNGTETHGRDGFYIHGGDTKGSKGCIDIGNKDRDFFRNVRKTKNKVKVRVH
ncbi:RHS repeat-associated core domain-containing protein [Maridesulfovibrio sp. FT414]|uniref:RHS repeat-associated core domain-containing protein n=1 Tax=Maridesulfovibrio sp. FT414 TaxID=2979469 RepID=UPI003D807E0B